MLASRWALELLPDLEIAFPERYLGARIGRSTGAIEIHVAHLPPGSSRGLIKTEMFEALWARLARPAEAPRIPCGDFNTPRAEMVDGKVEFWGGTARTASGALERCGAERHPRADVFRTLNGYAARDTSWIRRQGSRVMERRYDHVFAAASLHAKGCRYHHHAWREDGLSDHAPIEVDLDYQTE